MRFSLRFLTIATIITVTVFWLFLVLTTSYSFYVKMVERVTNEKIVLVRSVQNIITSPDWTYRQGLNVGSGATRIFIEETAKTPGVIFFRLKDDETNIILFSSVASEEGTNISHAPVAISDISIQNGMYNKESIVEIVAPAIGGQSLWMGISTASIRSEAIQLIIRELAASGILIAILIGLLYLLNKKAFSDVQKYQKDLERALSLVSTTIESTVDGILVVDRKGKIAKFNQKFVSMWKIPKDIIDTKDDDKALSFVVSQLVDPDGFIKKVKELYNKPEEESFDVIQFKDGKIFERYSIPQRLENDFVGRVWNFRDITERKHQEDKLKESTELLQKRTQELEETNRFMTGREIRMTELKNQIQKLEQELTRARSHSAT